jgi:hypothetical protein
MTGRSYLLKAGEDWLMLPPRIAALIERRTNISSLRVQVRGVDPEATDVLEQLRMAALSWSSSSTGTTDDESRELAAPSKWMGTSEVAKGLGQTREAVGKAIRTGRLAARKLNDRYQIDREDYEHYKAVRAAREA